MQLNMNMKGTLVFMRDLEEDGYFLCFWEGNKVFREFRVTRADEFRFLLQEWDTWETVEAAPTTIQEAERVAQAIYAVTKPWEGFNQ